MNNIFKITQFSLRNDIRYYARWVHRRPKKILTEEQFDMSHKNSVEKIAPNVIELDRIDVKRDLKSNKKILPLLDEKISKYAFDIDELDKKTHFDEKKVEKKVAKVKYTSEEVLDTTFDSEGNFIYTKMKDNDPKIGSLMLMVKSKKMRDRKEKILLEGKRLIKDALETNCELECLIFSRKSDLKSFKHLLPKTGVKLYKMAYKDIQLWSDLTTSPGVMAIVKIPNTENIKQINKFLPITIICDNIREPGNLGAILRASVAVGCKNIILTKGCVDLWDPKVLRSASGAHFRLKIDKNVPWHQISNHLDQNTSIFLADNKILTSNIKNSENLANLCSNVHILPYFGVDFGKLDSLTLIIGGETLGLSENAYDLALNYSGVRLNIPLENNVESLNTSTALGIIIFEIKRQILCKQ